MKKVLITIVALLFACSAFATNGYFSHGYGVQSKGMAGVGAALPQNSLAAATNPAGMVFLGQRFDFSIGLFSPSRQYTVTGNPSMMTGTFGLVPQTVESDSKLFAIPSVGANFKVCSKGTIGISIYGNGGMNTNYDEAVFFGSKPTGVDLSQLFVGLTFSRKIADKHALGITGIFAYQMFKAEGLEAFSAFSSDPAKLTNNDHANSTGFGARFGYLGELTDGFFFGASYQTRIYMSEFDEYSGLFAEQGDFDIPSNFTVGMAWQATKKLMLAADVQHVFYSEIKSVGNPMDPAKFQEGILLGSDDGSGFGWDDMTVFKFGLEYEALPDLPVRLGYSYGKQPIPEEEMLFNILAPGVIEHHISFGFSREFCGKKELSFAVTHGLSKTISGPNPMDIPDQQDIELKMHQWDFVIGFGF